MIFTVKFTKKLAYKWHFDINFLKNDRKNWNFGKCQQKFWPKILLKDIFFIFWQTSFVSKHWWCNSANSPGSADQELVPGIVTSRTQAKLLPSKVFAVFFQFLRFSIDVALKVGDHQILYIFYFLHFDMISRIFFADLMKNGDYGV